MTEDMDNWGRGDLPAPEPLHLDDAPKPTRCGHCGIRIEQALILGQPGWVHAPNDPTYPPFRYEYCRLQRARPAGTPETS